MKLRYKYSYTLFKTYSQVVLHWRQQYKANRNQGEKKSDIYLHSYTACLSYRINREQYWSCCSEFITIFLTIIVRLYGLSLEF